VAPASGVVIVRYASWFGPNDAAPHSTCENAPLETSAFASTASPVGVSIH